MYPIEQLIKAGIIKQNHQVTRSHITEFYKSQLLKLEKLGIGSETENGVIITPELIDITKKRLNQLLPLKKGKIRRRIDLRTSPIGVGFAQKDTKYRKETITVGEPDLKISIGDSYKVFPIED